MLADAICIPGKQGTVGKEFQANYPGNKAVSHILRKLLILLQLFEEDAARGEKGESDTTTMRATFCSKFSIISM